MTYKLGIDVGGTFTDFALVNEKTGTMAIYKQLTTPRDPSECVLDGTRNLLAAQNVSFDQVRTVVHGTTLVTNAVIERKGAVTGMLTTAGFRDILDIARERRYDLFDLRIVFPEPLCPRPLRFEVHERIRYDGEVIQALDLDEARKAVTTLVNKYKIESLAVCLLHSYKNPLHEQQIHTLLTEEFPELYVSTSAEVFPFMREYERFTTTTINAYVQPMVDRYLERIETGLQQQGFKGNLYIMTSSGGTVTTTTARRFPVRLLESGPTAGALMTAHIGRTLNFPNLLSYDTGGTSSKGALIRGGATQKKYEIEVARIHEFKQGSGLLVKAPAIDMIEIGTGGGSIAEVDERGLIQVGPRSAGADPGPACYGRDGKNATLTDANLVLGYLDPKFFVGGRMKLDRAASERAIMENIGKPLGLDLTSAAWGIHEIANENCARAFRVHASERGIDYRNCSMVAFGGCGPIHGVRVAKKLKIPRVIFPLGAGVFSAFGLLVSPLSFDLLRSRLIAFEDLTPARFTEEFQPLIDEASGLLKQAGVEESDIRIARRLDMRYQGQGFEIEVLLPHTTDAETLLGKIPKLFTRSYEKTFSISSIKEPIEIVNWKIETTGPPPEVGGEYIPNEVISLKTPIKGKRPVYFSEPKSYIQCPVYDRYALQPGTTLEGPAVVEERESTCIIGIGDIARVDDRHNLVADITEKERDDKRI